MAYVGGETIVVNVNDFPRLRLVKTYRDGACPIAFIDYKNNKTSSMVEVDDRSDEIPQNSHSWYFYEKVPYSSGYYKPKININDYPSGHIMVTDKYLSSTDKNMVTPLFSRYDLKYDNHSTSSVPGAGVYVYRDDGILMDQDTYKVEYASGSLTSDMTLRGSDTNAWGTGVISDSGDQRIRLLFPESYMFDDHWYDVKYSKSAFGGIDNSHKEFINPSTIYEQDVDYTVDSSGTITFGTDTIWVKKKKDTTMKLMEPTESSIREGWYAKVKAGSIVIPSGVTNATKKIYSIEYDRAGQPSYISDAKAMICPNTDMVEIRDNTFQVQSPPIHQGASGYYFPYVEERLEDGISEFSSGNYGYTIYLDGVELDNSIVKDVQYQHGILRMNEALRQGELKISYLRDSEEVIISSLDLNPTINHLAPGMMDYEIKDHRVEVYATPASGIPPTGHVMWKYEGEASGYYAIGDGTLSPIPSDSILLGNISIMTQSKDSAEIIDIRRRGGLKEEFEKHTIEKDSYSDIGKWDGKFFPKNGAAVFQIPLHILTDLQDKYEEEGNTKNEAKAEAFEYITDTIEKYIPIGLGYVIIDENKNIWPMQPKR